MIFPAIDLQDGRSVRLYKGDFAQETVINPDPVDQAKQYEAAKVGALHLVDLDGAKTGKPVNVDIVKAVRAAFTGILEIGGGIRDKEAVDLYLSLGVDRVILGSVALKHPEFTKQVTDVDRDGTMQGANEELLGNLQKEFPTARIVASGGVRNLADIKSLEEKGVMDSIVGKALYEGTITLEEIAEYNQQK